MVWVAIALAGIAGVIAGYTLAVAGTWARLHKQESELRALINAIEVEKIMTNSDRLSSEWVLVELETMLRREFR